MTVRVLAVGNNNTTQTDHRSLIASLTAPSTSTAQLPGFFPANNVGTLTNVSAMVVGVGAFRAVVFNVTNNGHYLVQSDTQVNLTFDPGEAGVTRTDRIIVRVYNDAQDGSGRNEAVVEYLKGQSSGSASPLPNNSLLMWEVPVPAGASAGNGGINFVSTAVDKRSYTTASGGIIPVTGTSDMNAIANPYEGMTLFNRGSDILYVYDGTNWRAKGQVNVQSYSNLSNVLNPEEGTMAYVKDVDLIYVYDGSNWRIRSQISATTLTALNAIQGAHDGLSAVTTSDGALYYRSGGAWVKRPLVQAGQATVNFSASNFGSVVVNFPKAFASQPSVVAMLTTGSGVANGATVRTTTQSATSATIGVTLSAAQTTSLTVNWIATEIV